MFVRIIFILIFQIGWLVNAIGQGFVERSDDFSFTWEYGIGEYGGGPSFVDFNLDGLDDVTIPSGFDEEMIFLQSDSTDFTFLTPLVSNLTEVKQVLWVDYDNDGDLDLYLTSRVLNALYKNTGDFVFEDITSTCGFNDPLKQTFCASWFDYDEDGLLDVLVSHRLSFMVGDLTLYRNLGNDQFEDVSIASGLEGFSSSPLAMATFDMNNDGLEDIYVVEDYEAGNLMFRNNGDGTFDNISVSSGTNMLGDGMSATIGDFNNDGWMDIYVTNTPGGNVLYVNQGDETFEEQADEFGLFLDQFTFGAVWLDAENDRDIDLYINGNMPTWTYNSKMMRNNGDDSLFEVVNDAWGFDDALDRGRGVATGDYNNDGFPDLVKMNYLTEHTFWENDFSENNYIKIDLRGTTSNFMAVGSVITVHTDSVQQKRRIGCGEGWSSQNSYTQLFGLGTVDLIDSIHVQWPNGGEDVIHDVESNQRILLTEGQITGCTDEEACNYVSWVYEDDGSCVYAEEFMDCEGNCLNDSDGDFVCDELEIPGCQDQDACNYNSEATDPGDCSYVDTFAITGELNPDENTVVIYSYPNTSGSEYLWQAIGGEILAGQGTSEVTIEWDNPGVGVVSVTEIQENCEGETVDLEVDIQVVSVEEFDVVGLSIYPNPSAGVVHIKGLGSEGRTELQVIGLSGELVKRASLNKDATSIDLSELAHGVYTVLLVQDQKVVGRKLLVLTD